MFAVRFSDEIDARLKKLSNETNRSRAFYVRQAVEQFLDEYEELYLAEKRLIDFRSGRGKSIPLSEVMKEYDMAS